MGLFIGGALFVSDFVVTEFLLNFGKTTSSKESSLSLKEISNSEQMKSNVLGKIE